MLPSQTKPEIETTTHNIQTKMKLSVLATVSAFTTTGQRDARDVEENFARTYSQLMAMMKNYNPSFDYRKYLIYGCHCLFMGKLINIQ